MKSKKGFTLIELLAIIVILAIIAVITVPIILTIIDNSKKGAAIDSAYGYKDAVNKWYVTKLSSDSSFFISDGQYTFQQLKGMGVNINGQEPRDNSWVVMSKNMISAGCLQFDEYKVSITDGIINDAEKGECEEYIVFNGTYIAPSNADTHKGIVYMNPEDLSTECSETVGYSESQSIPGVKSGCMKFYIYNINDNGTVDMILDHNTSYNIKWSGGSRNYNGPREALYQLHEDTKDWLGVRLLTSNDNYSMDLEQYVLNYDTNQHEWVTRPYEIDYTKVFSRTELQPSYYSYQKIDGENRARLITIEEIVSITGKTGWSFRSDTFFGFDNRQQRVEASASNPSDYKWLYENLDDCVKTGCGKESPTILDGNWYYWTATPSSQSESQIWVVRGTGYTGKEGMSNNPQGIRPVVSLNKSILGI